MCCKICIVRIHRRRRKRRRRKNIVKISFEHRLAKRFVRGVVFCCCCCCCSCYCCCCLGLLCLNILPQGMWSSCSVISRLIPVVKLTLKELSCKLATLIAIVSGQICQAIHNLSLFGCTRVTALKCKGTVFRTDCRRQNAVEKKRKKKA